MIRVDRPIVVEGRYDKSKLSSLVDAPVILTTDGFGVFSDKGKLQLIRELARESGIILLTDSDTAGFRIRSYLKGCVEGGRIAHVYIPDVYGKERRKKRPSKEGKLGVEGIDAPALIKAFHRAGVVCGETRERRGTGRNLSKADFYELGLSGTPGSTARRKRLIHALDLPENMSANALIEVLSLRFTPDGLREYLQGMDGADGEKEARD